MLWHDRCLFFSPRGYRTVLTICIHGFTDSTFRRSFPVQVDSGAAMVRDPHGRVPLANVRHARVPLCALWSVARWSNNLNSNSSHNALLSVTVCHDIPSRVSIMTTFWTVSSQPQTPLSRRPVSSGRPRPPWVRVGRVEASNRVQPPAVFPYCDY